MSFSVPIAFFAEIQRRTERDRHACEVNYLAGMKSHADREAYLGKVLEKRGTEEWRQLRGDVWLAMNPGLVADYALGAMHAGVDARRAVRIASRLDIESGMGVDVVRF